MGRVAPIAGEPRGGRGDEARLLGHHGVARERRAAEGSLLGGDVGEDGDPGAHLPADERALLRLAAPHLRLRLLADPAV